VSRKTLYARLHSGIGAAARAAVEPVSVTEEVAEVLHRIPKAPAAHAEDSLARIRAETEQATALLATIFKEEEPQVVAQHEAIQEGPLAGLDPEHARIVGQLLDRVEWPRAEFDALASAAGLMPGGAMETINEWAFDRYTEALLEDGDPVVVNVALLGVPAG